MRHPQSLLRALGHRRVAVVLAIPSVNGKEISTKAKQSALQALKDAFESARSISLSILIIVGGVAAVVAVGREAFSEDILIDVTEISKQIADSGISATTLAAELAARVRTIQAEADSKNTFPTIELAYILQSENKTKALPTLPSSTQKLLIDHIEPLPELITSAADSKVRTAINYIRHVFGRQDNRLSIVLTSTENKKFESRLRLRRKGVDAVTTISRETVDELLTEIPRWLAKELFPEEYIIAQFARERRKKERNFAQTKAMIQELAHRRGALDDNFLRTILGDIAFHGESYEEASAIYKSVISTNPKFKGLVLYRLTQSLVAEAKADEAAILLTKAIDDSPTADLVSYLALLYAQIQSSPDARRVSRSCAASGHCLSLEAVIKRLESDAPASAAASNALGVLLYQNGNVKEAEKLFVQSTKLDAKYASVLNNLGVIRLKQDRAGEALILLQSAAAINEDSGVVQLNLGNALERFGRFEEAAQYFSTAALLDRENLVCHTCWALSLVNANRMDEASSAIRTGLTLDPGNTSILLVSAIISTKLGCHREASEVYEAAIAAADRRVNKSMIYRGYANSLMRLGKRQDAITMFRNEARVLRFSSGTDDVLNLIVANVYVNGRKGLLNAVEEFDLEVDGNDLKDPHVRKEVSRAYKRFADALLWADQSKEALDAANRAVELDPKEWEVHHTLGRVYVALRKNSIARSEFRLAMLLGGENDLALLMSWTRSLKSDGLKGEARALLTEFKLHPRACVPNDL